MGGFKIVAVLKKRKNSTILQYSYVPHQWEKNGTLFWPRSGTNILRNDAESVPEDDWLTYKCKLKKTDIMGLDEAQLWEEEFIGASNTEAEESLTISSKKATISTNNGAEPASNAVAQGPVVITGFDNLFNNIGEENNVLNFLNQNGQLVISNQETTLPSLSQDEEILRPETISSNFTTSQNNSDCSLTIENLYNELEDIKNKQETMIRNFQIISDKVTSNYTQLIAITDNIYKMLNTIVDQLSNQNLRVADVASSPNNVIVHEKFSFPLDTVENILAFNNEILVNIDYKNYLIETYKSVGGTEGQEEGKGVAKKLLCILFTKSVLTHFSWTGISRTSGLKKKEPFQSLEGIVSLFNELIKMADTRWCSTKNETFFKLHVLKHAKQMNEAYEKKKASTTLTKATNIEVVATVHNENEISDTSDNPEENNNNM